MRTKDQEQGFESTVDGSLYDKDGTATSFDFYRIFEIMDCLDGEIWFGVRYGPGIWGLYQKQPVHPFLASNRPPPLLHHA